MDTATFVEMARATRDKVDHTTAFDPKWNAYECVTFLRKEAERIWEEEAQQRNITTTTQIGIWYDAIAINFCLSFKDPELKLQVCYGVDCTKWREIERDRRRRNDG